MRSCFGRAGRFVILESDYVRDSPEPGALQPHCRLGMSPFRALIGAARRSTVLAFVYGRGSGRCAQLQSCRYRNDHNLRLPSVTVTVNIVGVAGYIFWEWRETNDSRCCCSATSFARPALRPRATCSSSAAADDADEEDDRKGHPPWETRRNEVFISARCRSVSGR